MKFNSLLVASVLAGYVVAEEVACKFGDQTIAQVDSDSGECPFDIPKPSEFNYGSDTDFKTIFYYALLNGEKYFSDIANSKSSISIPAKALKGKTDVPIYKVEKSSSSSPSGNASNGTVSAVKRDIDDLIGNLKNLDGDLLEGLSLGGISINVDVSLGVTIGAGETAAPSSSAPASSSFTVGTPVYTSYSSSAEPSSSAVASSSAPASSSMAPMSSVVPSSTVTSEHATVMTVTSCEQDKCATSEVPATTTVCPTTVNGVETEYTTVCPLTESSSEVPSSSPSSVEPESSVYSAPTSSKVPESTVTDEHTTVVTVTSCDHDKCATSEVPGKETVTTVTTDGVETEYTTVCPVDDVTTTPASSPEASVTPTSSGYDSTSTLYITEYITISRSKSSSASSSPSTIAPVASTSTPVTSVVSTITVNGVETAFTTVCPVSEESSMAPTTEAPSSVVPATTPGPSSFFNTTTFSNTTTFANTTTPTTLAPVPITSSPIASKVCTGPDCAITETMLNTVTLSSSSAPATVEPEVSTFEGKANAVNGLSAMMALTLGSLAWLI